MISSYVSRRRIHPRSLAHPCSVSEQTPFRPRRGGASRRPDVRSFARRSTFALNLSVRLKPRAISASTRGRVPQAFLVGLTISYERLNRDLEGLRDLRERIQRRFPRFRSRLATYCMDSPARRATSAMVSSNSRRRPSATTQPRSCHVSPLMSSSQKSTASSLSRMYICGKR